MSDDKLQPIDYYARLEPWTVSCFETPIRTLFSWRDDPVSLPVPGNPKGYGEGFTYQEAMLTYQDAILADSIAQKLLLSPSFRALSLYFKGANEIPFFFISHEDSMGLYDSDKREIELNFNIRDEYGDDPAAFIWIAAHEYRHGFHQERGVFENTSRLSLRDNLLLRRAYEADACAFEATVCWELKQTGDRRPWDILKASESYKAIANAFEEAVKKDDGAALNGTAQNAAYMAWFADEGLKADYDSVSCKIFEDNLEGLRLTFNDITAIDRKMHELSFMPFIDAYGSMVGRKNYLSPSEIGNSKGFLFSDVKDEKLKIKVRNLEIKSALLTL